MFLIIWAVFVSYSRIYIGVHYPLDILVGAFFGGIIGYAVYKVFLYFCSTKYFQSKG
ncbi:phosphatase PAP2 family protein [Ornithobacterium rhinotracheale]|uniref:phosphatase PAP2 family protein n=1 Tax=Ornithobacterium rhinotracheale TaxID=28251 RepID=UPI0009DB320C|nr:phosphatase PAP2 family protein [Ornithobacterium rhinotracheale]UVD88350.1 phosphatase PAP2 family protein [Ornithobacterium rhinotracheale]